MKKILFCSLFILLTFSLVGCNVNLPWLNNQGAPYTRLLGGAGLRTWGHGIAANASGIYITGETWGTGSLDGLTVIGDGDAFLAKYDTSGNKLKTILYYGEPNQSTSAYAVTADTSGVYITGGWHDGGASIIAFIAKYDNSGNKLWERKPITEYPTTPKHTSKNGWGIASDSTGVYVTGETNAWVSGKEIYNAFVTKYDAYGTMLWTQRIGSYNVTTSANAIAVDPSGDYVYVTGVTLDNLDGVLKGKVDFFAAKLDASTGEQLWVKQLGATADADALCHGIAISATSSDIYVICRSTNSDNFDGVSCPSPGSQSFMVTFDPSGNHQTKFLGVGRSNFIVEDIISDSTGVYAVGDSSGQAFVLKYDFSGNEVEIKTLNSLPTAALGNGIVKTASKIYITGYTDGDFDGQTQLGTNDAFITNKLNF